MEQVCEYKIRYELIKRSRSTRRRGDSSLCKWMLQYISWSCCHVPWLSYFLWSSITSTVLLYIQLPLHPISCHDYFWLHILVVCCCCEHSWPLVYAWWFFALTFFKSHLHVRTLFHTRTVSCTKFPWCWWSPLGFGPLSSSVSRWVLS